MEEGEAAAAGGSIGFGSAWRARRRLRSPSPTLSPPLLLQETTDRRGRHPIPPYFDTAYLPDHESYEYYEYEGDLELELEAAPIKRARIPASDEAIQGLKEVTASSAGDDVCAICLQNFLSVQEDDPLRAMPCSHTFHQRCIFEWLRRNAVCPLCRHQLQPDTLPAPVPLPPPMEGAQQQQRQQRRSISAYHFDDDEDAIAALGDDVIHLEFEEVSQEEVEEAEERMTRAMALIQSWMSQDREDRNRLQVQASEIMMGDELTDGSIEWIDGPIASLS